MQPSAAAAQTQRNLENLSAGIPRPAVLLRLSRNRPSLLLLLVDEFHQTLAQVVEVKDLDVENFNGPLDFRVHAVAVLQGVVQVLLRVLDAALQLGIAHLGLLQNSEAAGENSHFLWWPEATRPTLIFWEGYFIFALFLYISFFYMKLPFWHSATF